MTAQLIQRRPIIRIAPAEVRLEVTVPVPDNERVPREKEQLDLELEVGSRGRAVTVAGTIVRVEKIDPPLAVAAGATGGTAAKTPPAAPEYRLTIRTDGSWANGPARR